MGLTGDFEDGRGMLGSADAVGDLADVRSRVLRLDRRDDERSLRLNCHPTLFKRDGDYEGEMTNVTITEIMMMTTTMMMVVVVVMVMLGVPLGSADFMHDFNLETKHGFKIKTENVPRSKYCDCNLVS